MSFIESLKEFASKELELTGFNQTNFGKDVLSILENSAELCHNDPESMKNLIGLILRLIDRIPIAPITEDDFDSSVHDTEGKSSIARCERSSYVYQTPDGKYWDDRAVAFRYSDESETNKMYLYSEARNSKQEIELPYYPNETIIVIDKN
jgi:hypothetical protein